MYTHLLCGKGAWRHSETQLVTNPMRAKPCIAKAVHWTNSFSLELGSMQAVFRFAVKASLFFNAQCGLKIWTPVPLKH